MTERRRGQRAIKALTLLHKAGVTCLGLSHDGRTVFGTGHFGPLGAWDVASGERKWSVPAWRALSLSPDGKLLAVSGCNDPHSVKVVSAVSGEWIYGSGRCYRLVSAVAFLPDGETIACGCGESGLMLWNMRTGRWHEWTCPGTFADWFNPIAVAHDSRRLIADLGRGHANIWRLAWGIAGISIGELVRSIESSGPIAVSGDGRLIATEHAMSIMLWDPESGSLVRRLTVESDRCEDVLSLAFTPDGTHIVCGTLQGRILVLRASDGHHLRELEGHKDRVYSIAVSGDGRLVASGSEDGTIKLQALALA